MPRRKPRRGEAHVRLYRHELDCAAYRSLTPDSRAALVEFRGLFNGQENRVYMSIRELGRRLGVGQRRAQRARDDLLERGWLRLLEQGAFSRKARHASVYALTNEPLDGDGPAPKDFMRWQPEEKSTVDNSATDGSQSSYREGCNARLKGCHGSQFSYRQTRNAAGSVVNPATQISYQAAGGGEHALLWGAWQPGVEESARAVLCAAWVLLTNRNPLELAA